MGSISLASEYQEVDIRGIDKADPEQIVSAWARFGRAGLGALEHVDPAVAADALLSASQNVETEGDESEIDDLDETLPNVVINGLTVTNAFDLIALSGVLGILSIQIKHSRSRAEKN